MPLATGAQGQHLHLEVFEHMINFVAGFSHCGDGPAECFFLVFSQIEFFYFFEPIITQYYRDAYVHIVHTVFPVQIDAGRHDFTLIVNDRLGHFERRPCGRNVSRSESEQADYFAARAAVYLAIGNTEAADADLAAAARRNPDGLAGAIQRMIADDQSDD